MYAVYVYYDPFSLFLYFPSLSPPTVMDNKGRTALFHCLHPTNRHIKCLDFLLECGADPNTLVSILQNMEELNTFHYTNHIYTYLDPIHYTSHIIIIVFTITIVHVVHLLCNTKERTQSLLMHKIPHSHLEALILVPFKTLIPTM